MNQAEFDQAIFKEAKNYLIKHTPKEVTKEVVESYFTMSDNYPKNSMKIEGVGGFYHEILDAAQNNNMMSNVIGKSIGNTKNLDKVLFDFDPRKVLDEYKDNSEILFSNIKKKLKPKGEVRTTPRSKWPQFCKTIISAAEFLVQFENGKDYLNWMNYYYNDDRTIAALPLILSSEIHGLGFALACNFLKDIGYNKYGKPDTHVTGIFKAVGLVHGEATDYRILKALTRVATNVKLTPFAVDKVFYLLGSGSFHKHPKIGNKGKVPGLKKDFIEYMKKKSYKLD